MTVPTPVRKVSYLGNGATVDFPVLFPFFENEDLVVKKVLVSTGVAALQAEGADYTVTGAGAASGVVRMTAAPSNLYTLTIERTVPIVQEQAFSTQGPFAPSAHEAEFDYLTEICQQLADRLAAVEALGSLVSLEDLDAAMVNVTFTTAADFVEKTFLGGVVHAAIPAGFNVTGVLVAKVVGGAGGREAVMVRDWTVGDNLALGFVTGLEVNTTYTLTLLLLDLAVS